MASRKSTGIIPALLFIAVILLAVFYVTPLRGKVLALEQDLQQKNTELSALQKDLAELQKFQAELPADSALITRKIPVDLKEDQLIILMEKIAGDNNIAFSSLGFSPASRTPGQVSPVNISSSFEGSFKSLISFLEDLERTRERKFLVRSVSVTLNEPEGTPETDITAEVTGPKPKGTGKFFDENLVATFTLQLEAYYQGVIK